MVLPIDGALIVKEIAANPSMPALEVGEFVTTGTLTDPMPIASGQTWTTTPLRGIDLEPANLSFS